MIGVNSNNPKVRQRFTIGHELGHLTLHHGHDLILERLVRLNFRDATSSTASDEEEIEANHFAAELLMPQDLLRHSLSILLQGRPLSDLEVVRRLARRFEVSQSAMEYRLTSLGMLTPGLRIRSVRPGDVAEGDGHELGVKRHPPEASGSDARTSARQVP